MGIFFILSLVYLATEVKQITISNTQIWDCSPVNAILFQLNKINMTSTSVDMIGHIQVDIQNLQIYWMIIVFKDESRK